MDLAGLRNSKEVSTARAEGMSRTSQASDRRDRGTGQIMEGHRGHCQDFGFYSETDQKS